MLGKALPYLSSLVTIKTLTRSTRSSRYFSLVIPKANTSFGHLSVQFSAANDWSELQKSLKLDTYISLTEHQLTDRCSCTQPICKHRRLAGLERQNAECRQTELVLFSLLLSACLLNGWLWIRR
uniref:SWIM-type domain-containing protein n=1 Tax=Oncorhynchus mykiss TaxID=8022 RepID=A0A8K9XM44_ONCMY